MTNLMRKTVKTFQEPIQGSTCSGGVAGTGGLPFFRLIKGPYQPNMLVCIFQNPMLSMPGGATVAKALAEKKDASGKPVDPLPVYTLRDWQPSSQLPLYHINWITSASTLRLSDCNTAPATPRSARTPRAAAPATRYCAPPNPTRSPAWRCTDSRKRACPDQ